MDINTLSATLSSSAYIPPRAQEAEIPAGLEALNRSHLVMAAAQPAPSVSNCRQNLGKGMIVAGTAAFMAGLVCIFANASIAGFATGVSGGALAIAGQLINSNACNEGASYHGRNVGEHDLEAPLNAQSDSI